MCDCCSCVPCPLCSCPFLSRYCCLSVLTLRPWHLQRLYWCVVFPDRVYVLEQCLIIESKLLQCCCKTSRSIYQREVLTVEGAVAYYANCVVEVYKVREALLLGTLEVKLTRFFTVMVSESYISVESSHSLLDSTQIFVNSAERLFVVLFFLWTEASE